MIPSNDILARTLSIILWYRKSTISITVEDTATFHTKIFELFIDHYLLSYPVEEAM